MLKYIFFLFILFTVYSIFTYALTDPNLVLSSNDAYWKFQSFMWNNFYHVSVFLTYFFAISVILMFVVYAYLVIGLKNSKETIGNFFKSKYIAIFLLLIFPLFLSYNSLSYDVFNYAFNAKMVVEYQANPHREVALDYADDEWVRFMHNVHTPAPYGYTWTALSLVPYLLGFGKLLPTLFLFKVMSVFSLVLLYFALEHLSITINKRKLYLGELTLVFLNPLLLIEVVSNYHNDLWMMVPAIFAVSYLIRSFYEKNKINKNKSLSLALLSLILIGISISIKLATLVLLPVFIFILTITFFLKYYSVLIQKRFKLPIPQALVAKGLEYFSLKIVDYIPTLMALLMFIPLLTARSQQFLPWYLIWVLVWLPFIKNALIRNTIIVFSFSSLLRYLPWLYNSFEYSPEILQHQKLITWLIPFIYLFTRLRKKSYKIINKNKGENFIKELRS
jgi:hypothetical protein